MRTVIIQLITACTGTIAFSMLFNQKKSRLLPVAIGALISWSAYLIFFNLLGNNFIGSLIAALIVCIYSEILARVLKAPANIFLVPSIIPLLPGGNLYYTMTALLRNDNALFRESGIKTISSVLGITMGIIIGFFAATYFSEMKSKKNLLNRKSKD